MARQYIKTVYKFDELSDSAKEKAREWFRGTDCQDFHDVHGESVIEDFCEIAGHLGFDISADDVEWSGFSSQGDGASFTGVFTLSDMNPEALSAWGKGETIEACLRDALSFRKDALRFYGEVLRCLPFGPQGMLEKGAWGQWRYAFTKNQTPNRVSVSRSSSRYSHEYTMQVDSADDWADDIRYFMGDREYDECGVDDACKRFASAIQEFARSMAQNLYRALEREYEYQNSDDVTDENIRTNGYEFTEEGERD